MGTTSTSTDDDTRRAALFAGEVRQLPAGPAAQAFRDHAWTLVVDAFSGMDPHVAQDAMPVEDFVAVLAVLKPAFVHDARSKVLLGDLLEEAGCDRSQTYFDLPKLRVVTHSGYLTSGLGYAYLAHRDVWYAAPPCQVNWWMPLTPVQRESTLAFHPQFWERPVPNGSERFDPYVWNATGRANAAAHVTSDTRGHPHAADGIDLADDVRLLPAPGESLVFSAAQLHSTVPNTSGRTRFSVDFRTVALSDLRARAGARLVDTATTGTTLRDYLRADDFSPVPADLVEAYDTGSDHRGVLVYEGSSVPAAG